MNRKTVLPYDLSHEFLLKQYQPSHSIYHAPVWEAPGVRKGEIKNPGDSKEVYEKTRNTFEQDYKLRKPLIVSENYEALFKTFSDASPYRKVAKTTTSITKKKNIVSAK